MTIYTGYAIEKEDREMLKSTATKAKRLLSLGDVPEWVDPRQSKLAQEAWLRVENQLSIGSCQGASLTECLEYCYGTKTNIIKQFSKMYAYLLSQEFDRINGDQGSTLSGGTKAALAGICEEGDAPYPNQYPGKSWITQTMREKAKAFRLKSHTAMESASHIKQFIGSGAGIVQIGIKWWDYMQSPPGGLVTQFSPPARGFGGHAVVFAGYVPRTRSGKESPEKYWFLLKNSHGTRYADEGYAYVLPSVVDRMLKDPFTVMYGRSDMDVPDVRTLPHDFTKPGGKIYV
jgi:C1A family cysteine protease